MDRGPRCPLARDRRDPSPRHGVDPTQPGQFLDAAESDRLYAFSFTSSHCPAWGGPKTSARSGAHVSWEVATIAVHDEFVVDGWTPIQTTPGTAGSQDTVKDNRGTLVVLREHRARQLAEKDERNARRRRARRRPPGTHNWIDTGKIFTEPDGSWLHPDHVSRTFKCILATTVPLINLRDCRHGTAGLVKAVGGQIEDAKLRHSTIVLTYMPLFEEFAEELSERSAAAVPRAAKARPADEEASPGGEATQKRDRQEDDDGEGDDGAAVDETAA